HRPQHTTRQLVTLRSNKTPSATTTRPMEHPPFLIIRLGTATQRLGTKHSSTISERTRTRPSGIRHSLATRLLASTSAHLVPPSGLKRFMKIPPDSSIRLSEAPPFSTTPPPTPTRP